MGKRKPLMGVGYILTGALLPLIAVTTSWVQVFSLRIGAWAGREARSPPRDALLADSVSTEDRGKAFGFHVAMDTMGAAIGPALALFFMTFLSYRQIISISVIPSALAIIVVIFLLTERNVKVSKDEKPVDKKNDLGFIDSIRSLPRPFVLFLGGVGVFGLGNFANSLFTLRAQQVLAPTMGQVPASVTAVGLYLLMNVVYMFSALPLGALSDRIGRRGILATGYFISAVVCLATAFLTSDFIMLIPVFAFGGFFTAITETMEGASAADLLPNNLRGTGYGVLQTINGIGDFASSAIVGVLWTLISPTVAFEYAAVLSASGGILLLYLTRAYSKQAQNIHVE